ncbi:hypothetical protein [Streptomyces sp. XY006]|uniref:hypothetical protein n=1 Tax=Streptomyces sp. XY006 TaxID=2021410 RepID=UPI000B8C3E62|nr:hypothetical protein [Streptomyces sp. XY006]OXS32524.1 hypothetical protein CHR28_25640 [Streptomyces sp. XY006]
MTADQLPAEVREFANYLDGLLARLDPSGGWCAVFWQRDPEGMRACLDGRELPPWDVVESLLRDLAEQYGPGGVGPETEHARFLHTAALAAYDGRPGGREALADRLDVMLREQKYAAERQAALARQLTSAATREQADALRRDLAWAHDDHARATARCAELRARMTHTHRSAPRSPTGQWAETTAPHDADGVGQGRGGGGGTVAGPRPGVASGYGAGEAGQGRGGGRTAAPAPYGAGAHEAGRGAPHPASRTEPRQAAAGGVNASTPLAAPAAFAAPAAPARFAAPSPSPAAPDPAPGSPSAASPSQAVSGPQGGVGKVRKRRRGGARFAGAVEEEDVVPGVVSAVVPGLPAPVASAGGRTPRGARFAGAAEEAVEERPVGEGTAVAGDADRDEVARVVETLARLRAEGRSGEAHALLVEAASWGPARFPLLAERLHRAGLDADWQTLLWEAAALPAGQLVAAADALAAAGRAGDGRQMLRQGVARPPGEIGRAVLALADGGRRREVRVLLDAYVTARTPEEAARSAEPDPQRLVPLLLEAAAGVSDERRWDLVHALRVAGHPA